MSKDLAVTETSLVSKRVSVGNSAEEMNRFFYEKGWTDGLPIICPTEKRVLAMLQYADRDPQEVVGKIAPLYGEATMEKISINAVMAGCLPKYLPAVVAAVEAMAAKEFNLYGIQGTTNPVSPAAVFNGPIVKEIDINCGSNLLGQGHQANATIGRALRLIMMNIGGGKPGTVDKATHGQPGKYSFCFAENEAESPWEPLHVERGFARDVSTVTMVGVTGTTNVITIGGETDTSRAAAVQRLLATIADAMCALGANNWTSGIGEPIVLLPPESAKNLAGENYSKAAVKQYLFENSSRLTSSFPPGVGDYMARRREARGDRTDRLYITERAEDIMILVGGGLLAAHAMFMPTFGATSSVTNPIALKDGTTQPNR